MNTIELIGPPGAGKSTYVSNEYNSAQVYAGRNDWHRCFLKSMPGRAILTNLPQSLQNRLIQLVVSRVRGQYERQFLCKYPGLLETIAPIIRHYEDKNDVLYYILREAAWFEIHSDRLTDNETYVIDDGLYQFHLRLMPLDGWDASRIMDRLPLPDKFVLIDAPADVCLDRQDARPRGRVPTIEGLTRSKAIDEIELMRENSKRFIQEAENRGVEVETIDTSPDSK
ncbi:hypothetical protein [Halorubrum tibetense]|uniref:NadR/Ttd14 AAA domain-containing protein n=1 Tax=Halorubrum tibetense TaxID=175631 RepID=A0ABD5S6P9_9EURY